MNIQWVKSKTLLETHFMVCKDTSEILAEIRGYSPYGGIVEYYEITYCKGLNTDFLRVLDINPMKEYVENLFKRRHYEVN